MADSDKNGIDIQRLFLAADLIADAQRLQPFRAIDCCYFTVKNENNVIMLLQLFLIFRSSWAMSSAAR